MGQLPALLSWETAHPKTQCRKRDVGVKPSAHSTELWTKANYMPPEARAPELSATLADSETLIEDLLWADHLLLSVPMYNFNVPSILKCCHD